MSTRSDRLRPDDSTVGKNPVKRDALGVAMRVLTSITGSPLAERFHLAPRIDRVAYHSTKTGFTTLGAVNRAFRAARSKGSGSPTRLATSTPRRDLFDLTPTDDQNMFVSGVTDFARTALRPAAAEANDAASAPPELLRQATELGVTLLSAPEEFEGLATERSVTTSALVAEALAYGDMGLAVAILAPSGVAAALTDYGSDDQQRTYLPSFASEDVPAAAVTLAEPHPLADPLSPRVTARREGSELVLDGVKSLVPRAGDAELCLVGVDLEGSPALVLVESGTEGVSIEADPSMGLRAAALGRLHLTGVRVPAEQLLGGADREAEDYAEEYRDIVRRARLGWAALATGTSRAVLDYVIPYVNEREAFGEPVSHRQAVAFSVADIATELDGLRLTLLRGCSRADQGLSFAREAGLARRFATEHGMTIGLDGVQLLGGHGYTKEHPVERWYRDLRAIGVAEGVVVL